MALCYWGHKSFISSTTISIILYHYLDVCLLDSMLSVCTFTIPFFIYLLAAYCSPPSNPVNGSVHSLTGTKLGSTLRFSCDEGFRLIGQSSATCTRTAQGIYQWNAPVPLCQSKSLALSFSLSLSLLICCLDLNGQIWWVKLDGLWSFHFSIAYEHAQFIVYQCDWAHAAFRSTTDEMKFKRRSAARNVIWNLCHLNMG